MLEYASLQSPRGPFLDLMIFVSGWRPLERADLRSSTRVRNCGSRPKLVRMRSNLRVGSNIGALGGCFESVAYSLGGRSPDRRRFGGRISGATCEDAEPLLAV